MNNSPLNVKPNFETTNEVCDEIIKILPPDFKYEYGDARQFKTQILPIVSNAMFHRDKELLEKERFETLITLARTLDDENLEKAISALKITLTKK